MLLSPASGGYLEPCLDQGVGGRGGLVTEFYARCQNWEV
jgi:hypothetical protein